MSSPSRRGDPSHLIGRAGSSPAIAHVGWTGTDADRDRWLAASLWLRRNDRSFARRLCAGRDHGALSEDCIDLNGSPPRDFLAEDAGYDVVLTHHLWGYPGLATAADAGPTACSPHHSPAAWRRRLRSSGARYLFLFGPHFNAGNLDECVPGYICFLVPALTFLGVFAALSPRRRTFGAPTRPITSVDMTRARLCSLSELRMNAYLDLSYTNVRRGHLEQLKVMPHLENLRLVGTGIADADLELVVPSHGLKTLDLDKTRISNAGLSHVKKLAHLECLSLNHTKVDDAGLQHLRALGKLTWLSLVDTAISDRGLDHLQEIPSLRSLALVQTRVTPSGLEALQRALPACAIAFGSG